MNYPFLWTTGKINSDTERDTQRDRERGREEEAEIGKITRDWWRT